MLVYLISAWTGVDVSDLSWFIRPILTHFLTRAGLSSVNRPTFGIFHVISLAVVIHPNQKLFYR